MKFQKILLFFLSIFCLTTVLFAQQRFDGDKAFYYIQQLCQPEFEGRKTGLPGARKAAEWIASQFKNWGLKPGGEKGTYLQEFPFIVTHQQKVAQLELKNGLFGAASYQEGNDFTVYFNSGSGKLTAEVVFVGYGISEPDRGRDDYDGIDVTGKIALIYRDVPKDDQDWTFANERDYKMQMASKHGAAGVLMLETRDWAIRGGTIHEEGYNPELPAFNITKKVARDIFQGTYHNLDHTIRDLVKAPQSFSTQKIVSMQAVVKKIEPGIGENVIGILTGNDTELKDEYIVVGAHIDHNGVSPDGHAYVGADDNASGTAVIMELARMFANRQDELKRSIVFIGFGGEEQGLRGSKFFTEHPTVPTEKICLMFNFDMEGQGDGGCGFGGRNYFPELIDEVVTSLSDSVIKKLSISRGWGFGGTDHAHFIEQGIPAFGFYSTGDHPFYHRMEDVPAMINVESLQFVGDRAAELLMKFASYPASLLFNGNKQSRTFVLFGDQIEFNQHQTITQHHEQEQDLKAVIQEKNSQGIRAIVLPIIDPSESKQTNLKVYHAIDSLNQWINENKAYFIRYENGNALDQAASSGKLAIALGIEGSAWLEKNIALLRNLSKLGLNVIRFNNETDPAFNNDQLSPFGQEVFKICQEQKVVIDWTIKDDLLTANALNNYTGNVVIRRNCSEIKNLSSSIQVLLEQKNILSIVECSENCHAEDLATVINLIGEKNIHISVVPSSDHKKIQQLYEHRLTRSDKKNVYEAMVRLMGGNLKQLLR